ncbi:hypothetical protein BU24DRAFT_465278 [Aaosphaeria arxii CBS 175.79]|uniref:Zn(2)-C6 fungal-type domain-containing protein n=1 Tax=Aaosphaeria arxii CBS 175.79 TaxID=1450172 RepID=A0A6A5XJ88_9PLEO|nr:uncharacterized protein BU24DRAFT_465278 [Aaosphaeria arxii CBS 175.79]KAF2012929.1 hypothetical protein BU24DRAFT_465278 [Aaosphaeria arxii CBS 175.79]
MDAKEGRIGNAFACERCRKHKVRCVPSETTGLCQRCQKARVECIEHVARRRPAKPRTTVQNPSRVAEMEKKLDKLSAIVTATSPAPNSASATQPSLPPVATTLPTQISEIGRRTPTPVATPIVSATTPSKPSISSIPPVAPVSSLHSGGPVLPNHGSPPESASSFWESLNETLSGVGQMNSMIRTIGGAHMKMLIESFRSMSDFFPFVTLPSGAFFQDLLQQRPILMFAAFTVASYDSATLQLTLSREFRNVVMVRTMKGDKSLDLVQGLLVFIAWHHHYMDSQAISIRTLLQLCIGIATDLGLDNLSSGSYSRDQSQHREGKRAYLGCYYLSSALGMLDTTKSRILSYSSILRTYASELASGWEHKTDSILPSLVETCHYVEDVQETFQNHSEPALVVRSQVTRLSDKWESMRAVSRQLPVDYKTLHWVQAAAKVHLYQIAAGLDIQDRDSTPSAPGFQLSLRISSLRSIEQFLETSLQLPADHYEYLSIVDWLNLIATLTILGKLALHATPMPGWDTNEVQVPRMFEHFREELCAKIPQPRDNGQDNQEHVFERFRRITAIMKMSLKNVHGRGSPNGSSFEITSSSRQAVSILQELPPLKLNGVVNGAEQLPTPWKVNPSFDMNGNDFPWRFLMGVL